MSDWWEPLYDDLLADVLLERADAREVDDTLGFVVDRLELRDGDRVFDQCSGVGSLSVPLAERGFRVVGVEQSASYVDRARQRAQSRGVSCDFIAGDARQFVPDAPCRGALNWWTSFGYAPDDGENRRMLERAFDALEPGGWFLLDTLNLPGVLRAFRTDEILKRDTPQGSVILLRESSIDLAAGALIKLWTFVLPDGRRVERQSRLRLFMPDALVQMLSAAGFERVELYGSVRGEPLALDSPRCICRARRAP